MRQGEGIKKVYLRSLIVSGSSKAVATTAASKPLLMRPLKRKLRNLCDIDWHVFCHGEVVNNARGSWPEHEQHPRC